MTRQRLILLVLCLLAVSSRARRDQSLPSIANNLINAASDIHSNDEDTHEGRRTFLSSLIHAAVPGAHRLRTARDEPPPAVASRVKRNTVRQATNSGGCGIGYRPNGTANVCVNNDCRITSLACGAQQVDPATYTGDISACTVLQVTCGSYVRNLDTDGCSPVMMLCGSTIVSASPPATTNCSVNTLLCLNPSSHILDFTASTALKCTVDELSCNGTPMLTPYTGDASNCTVNRRLCGPSESFSIIVLNCQSNGSCTYTSYDAEDSCFVADTSIPCKCPLDRIGSRCESGRPFACNFDLVSPQPECQQLPYPDSLLDGDPPCFTSWTRNEAILWQYNVRCTFLDTAGIDSYVEDPQFQYFVRIGNTFAISAPSGNDPTVQARLKVFNFNILSDGNASVVVTLTAAQLSGQAQVQFNLLLSEVPDKYYAGGRLYFEAGIISNLAGIKRRFDRRFIDPPDAPRVKRTDGGLSGGAIAGIVIGCIILVALVAGGAYLYIRRKRKAEKRRAKAMAKEPR